MRFLFPLLFLLIFAIPVFSQNATLTKGETVAYLERKLKEIDQHEVSWLDGYTYRHPRLSYKDGLLIISYHIYKGSQFSQLAEWKFNPLYIRKLAEVNSRDATPYVRIELTSSSAIYTHQYAGERSWTSSKNEVEFPFHRGDGTNSKKVQRALLHLQALLKAEDDPFAD